MVWAVDTNKLRQAAGSKDEKLRRMIGGRFKRDLASLDELFEDRIANGGPNTYEALRQIIDGAVPEGARGGIYSYAFKLLVEHFGRTLNNAAVYSWSSPDFGPVNAALKQLGVPFDVEDLTGWVGEEEVKRIAAAFEGKTYTGGDTQTGEILECVRGWFRDAAAQGRGLVSYYH